MADSGIAGLCQPQYFVHIGLMLWDTSRDQFDFFNIRRIIKLLLYNWRLGDCPLHMHVTCLFVYYLFPQYLFIYNSIVTVRNKFEYCKRYKTKGTKHFYNFILICGSFLFIMFLLMYNESEVNETSFLVFSIFLHTISTMNTPYMLSV